MAGKIFFVVVLLGTLSLSGVVFANDKSCTAEFHTKKADQQIIKKWTYEDGAVYEIVIAPSCGPDEQSRDSLVVFFRTFTFDDESIDNVKQRINDTMFTTRSVINDSEIWWIDYRGQSVSRSMTK